jgi:hypothetical protein
MAHGMDGAIDGSLIDSPVLSQIPRFGGFLAPLLVFPLGEQLLEETAIFFRELLDPIQDVINGCAAHTAPW